MDKAVPIRCTNCGWKTNRTKGECACYDEWAMYCRCAWGSCNKCNARVFPASFIRELEQSQRTAQ